MNRPSVLARFAGYPPIAALLFIGYAVIITAWYEGQLAWWLALGAVGAASKTLRAMRQVRSYKAWLADWHAMGAEEAAPSLPKRRRRCGWVFVMGAVLLLLVMPVWWSEVRESGVPNGEVLMTALTWLWLAVCAFLVWKLLRLLFRLSRRVSRRSSERRLEKAEAAPVEWLVSRASSSPSRADAVRNLPEYCARLIALKEK